MRHTLPGACHTTLFEEYSLAAYPPTVRACPVSSTQRPSLNGEKMSVSSLIGSRTPAVAPRRPLAWLCAAAVVLAAASALHADPADLDPDQKRWFGNADHAVHYLKTE